MEKALTLFKGNLIKVSICSNNMHYGPCPLPNEETEQQLTISRGGKVWLLRNSYGNGVIEEKIFNIDSEEAQEVFRTLEARFSRDYEIFEVTDIGIWEMTLTNTEGKEFYYSGSLLEVDGSAVYGLSDKIRKVVDREDLFVFDGKNGRMVL